MRLRPLTRLRLAFLGLGLVLLVPLWYLLVAVNQRVEEQRRLRHQVVAERIFDELERELNAVLEAESERPSEAYDQATEPGTWAPFVVGYFTSSQGHPQVMAGSQLSDERRRRLDWALSHWSESHQRSKPERALPVPAVSAAPQPRPALRATPAVPSAAPNSDAAVLRQLNRGTERRQRRAPPAPKQRDPMLDYGF